MNVNFTEREGYQTLLIGEALTPREKARIIIEGTIDAPLRYLEKQNFDGYVQHESHIIVDRDHLSITLVIGHHDQLSDIITGTLQVSREYSKFGINGGQYRTPADMAELIKMNRSYFDNKQQAMELVTKLRKFRAKIDKEMEMDVTQKGDRKMLLAQKVESNLPDSFKLKIPLFKGRNPELIEVEVYVNPDDLTCTLVSADANDSMESVRDSAIDDVLDKVKGICPSIAIIEK